MSDTRYAVLCFGILLADTENPASLPLTCNERNVKCLGDESLGEFILRVVHNIIPPTDMSSGYEKLREYTNRAKKEEQKSGLELISTRLLVVRASIRKTEAGEIHELDELIIPRPEWKEMLRVFCEQVGIEFQEPCFFLTIR